MNWFPFDLDAWNRHTKKLSHRHRGIYVTLLTWYYSTGGAIPLDWPSIFRIAEAHGEDERSATREVLDTFFDCRETGWHNLRADEEVTRYVGNAGNGYRDRRSVTGVTLAANRDTSPRLLTTTAKRQQLYRERKLDLIGALRRLGAHGDMAMTMGALREMAKNLGITSEKTPKKVTPKVTTDTREEKREETACFGVGGNPNGEADGESAEKSGISEDSPSVQVCRRVKQQGLFGLYPSHEKLALLLASGATVDEIVAVAAEAVAKGKGVAWMLAVAKGRRDDMSREPEQAQQGRKSGRGDFKTNRLREWVPELAATPPAPDFAFYDQQVPYVPSE
jgi:uncharacterized protein YdaU (DUF1376 family)